MSGQENGPKNFLDRWSRKKLDPEAEEKNEARETAAIPSGDALAPDSEAADGKPAANEAKPDGPEPAFDLSKLPSIESITAATDIRMFMLPGVPMALRQAALRKVWVTDPAIRDFIEMAENQWDFTVNSPGFDFAAPTGDIKKMVAEIFGKSADEAAEDAKQPPEQEKIAAETGPAQEISAENPVRLSGPADEKAIAEIAAMEPENSDAPGAGNFASQNNDAVHTEERETALEIPKRRHGSALPS